MYELHVVCRSVQLCLLLSKTSLILFWFRLGCHPTNGYHQSTFFEPRSTITSLRSVTTRHRTGSPKPPVFLSQYTGGDIAPPLSPIDLNLLYHCKLPTRYILCSGGLHASMDMPYSVYWWCFLVLYRVCITHLCTHSSSSLLILFSAVASHRPCAIPYLSLLPFSFTVVLFILFVPHCWWSLAQICLYNKALS